MSGIRHSFPLDPFQRRAAEAIDDGRSVVVAAPTGSGKTVVAEHAVAAALAAGAKAFYTTPVKALSNQKFHDLTRAYGPGEVGLLTGDNALFAEAPTVVMTTEVLRNMLYAGSDLLDGLRWVVLDEVHYLEDPYRGPVWEEVVIHLPDSVGLVCLSATVSNAAELADWISSVRGPTELVVEHRRPVPLRHEYLVGEKGTGRLHTVPLLVDGRPNRDGAQYDAQARRGRGGPRPRRRWVTPRRGEVVEHLRRRRLLPAIYFIFSRAGCEDAARNLASAGVELTTPDERDRIEAIVAEHLHGLSRADLETLEHGRWRRALRAGIASHHAGMVPPFKEAVEACFVEGLVKVVFATETLALGINMPARSVVVERLTKFTGDGHALLTAGQYTQLAGRAGRRGIDDVGHAVVLWSPWVGFDEVAALARSRSFELRSAFRPTYNMAANLVRRHDEREAHRLLRSSFGQFQAARRVEEARDAVAEKRLEADRLEAELARRLPAGARWQDLVAEGRGTTDRAARDQVEQAVRALRPGDALRFATGELGVALSTAQRGPFTRLSYVDASGHRRSVHSTALAEPPEILGRVELPQPFVPDAPAVVASTHRALLALVGEDAAARAARAPSGARRSLVRRARHLARLLDDIAALEQRTAEGMASLDRQFDRILGLLAAWGYVDGWSLTARGHLLVGIYHECDLLVAEALARGLLDGLPAPDLAGVLSCVVYEHRGAEAPPPPWYPTRRLRSACEALLALADELGASEDGHGVPRTRTPDPTFVPLAQAWAAGGSLDEVLEDEELTGGDFVRLCKQLVDLLGQVARVASDPGTREAARVAGDDLRRGIVAASSQVEVDDVEDGGASA